LAEILHFLGKAKTQAMYGAVSAIVGGSAQSIGGRLGVRRVAASWVVNASTLQPTGYSKAEIHPELTVRSEVIRTGAELKRRLEIWKSA
jgi:hypothetical protein